LSGCLRSECQTTILAQASAPGKLALDETRVYWSDTGTKSILAVKKTGAVNLAEIATGYFAIGLTVDEAFVYWTTDYGVFKNDKVAPTCDAASPGCQPFASGYCVGDAPRPCSFDGDIVDDGRMVHWVTAGCKMSICSDDACIPCWPGYSDTWTLSKNYDDQNRRYGGAEGALLAVDATHVYMTVPSAGFTRGNKDLRVYSELLDEWDGSNQATYGVAVDETHVYWSSGSGAILSMPKTLGPTGIIDHGFATRLALDETYVYYGNKRAPKTGGTPEVLPGPRGGTITDVLVDDAYIYWSFRQLGPDGVASDTPDSIIRVMKP
jgi:hypothetical protein